MGKLYRIILNKRFVSLSNHKIFLHFIKFCFHKFLSTIYALSDFEIRIKKAFHNENYLHIRFKQSI